MQTSWMMAAAVMAAVLAGCLDNEPRLPAIPDDSLPETPTFAFLPPVDLLCRVEDAVSDVQDAVFPSCGAFGEPVIEVAGDGTVWASATCCIGRSPPIWVSRDGGASFGLLPFAQRTGVVRDAYGIEGDFAIDDAGNVYFFDIALASTYFTKYQADGTHVFTKADAFPPLIDRPWVRGGVADEVWIFYNTGSATNLYHSTNGGLTWTLQPVSFGCPLMVFGQGATRDRLVVAGCTGEPKLWISENGGDSFGDQIILPVPDLGVPANELENGTGVDFFMPPVADADGTIYVSFTYATDVDSHGQGIWVDIVHSNGTVAGPFLISNGTTWNEKPWGAGGAGGHAAFAWYGTNATSEEMDDAEWFLYTAAAADADTATPHFQAVRADPEPVLHGNFGRSLGDFLQGDIGPDGRFYVIYAKRDDTGLTNRVVISDGQLNLGLGIPANGPKV